MLNTCGFLANQGTKGSTGSLSHHLLRKNSELYKQINTSRFDEIAKATVSNQTKISFKRICKETDNEQVAPSLKKSKHDDTTAISDILTQWNPKGEKTKVVDRLIMEMICVDIQPFSIVSDIRFKRLINYLAPKYQLKSLLFKH